MSNVIQRDAFVHTIRCALVCHDSTSGVVDQDTDLVRRLEILEATAAISVHWVRSHCTQSTLLVTKSPISSLMEFMAPSMASRDLDNMESLETL
jgi:hypothetical protein